jgi:hypothetical protein
MHNKARLEEDIRYCIRRLIDFLKRFLGRPVPSYQ